MLDRHASLQCSLSDHFSVEATLTYYSSPSDIPNHDPEKQAIKKDPRPGKGLTDVSESKFTSGGFLQSPAASLDISRPPSQNADSIDYPTQLKILNSTEKNLPSQTYDEILAMISKYQCRERHQRRIRLCHFILSVSASIACFIAVWFSPRNYVAFILMLISTLGLAAGVIDGLIGGLFVGGEIRALKEFEWEIRNVRGRGGGGGEGDGDEEGFVEGVVDW